LGYPDHGDFKNYWPANVQVIGKDILRFHAAIWPAMLMGLNLPLPSLLYVHGFITVADKKMSKSLGNVVSPKDIVDKYGADAFRYFFLRHIPSYGDGDFSWERLDEAYNSELADQLGNAVSRTAAMIQRYQGGVIGEIPAPEHDIRQYEDAVESFKFDVALSEVWDQVRGLNQYIDEQKPWLVAKSGDEEHLKELLSYLAGALLEIAELLVPFMPSTADKIKQVFASGLVKNLPETLFPKHDKAPVKQ
jgi:methionyl-tRNA synthetase